jgi:hypothetical protein
MSADNLRAELMSLTDVMKDYDVVAVGEHAVIVTERSTKLADPDMRELGTTGQSAYYGFAREEYNPALRGLHGLKVYDEMRRSDAQVRATLRLVKTPVLAARWYIEPATNKKRDESIAEFVWKNLTQWMTVSFPQLLTETLLMLDFGHYIFEKVYDHHLWKGDRKLIWRKFAPRHPMDVIEWKFDANGGPKGVRFYDAKGQEESTFIDIEKLAVFTFDKEAGNIQGISVLRSAYKHWYIKDNLYKIDAIQKERHGIGIPIIKLPAGFNDQDKAFADNLGRNLRTNEKAHVVLPPNWELMFAKLEGQPVNAIESIDHHDVMIARNILGQFINNPAGTSQEEQQQLFLKATRYIADIVRDVFNKYCIPMLVDWNWKGVEEYPELRVRRIGDTVDWRTISFAIRNFVGAGLIYPDEELEKWIRAEMDLPKADPATARIIVAPQQPGTIPDGKPDANPGPGDNTTLETRQNGGAGALARTGQKNAKAGLPRQSTAPGMDKTPGSNGRVGRDGTAK